MWYSNWYNIGDGTCTEGKITSTVIVSNAEPSLQVEVIPNTIGVEVKDIESGVVVSENIEPTTIILQDPPLQVEIKCK